jgi:hypothetical protein
MSGFWNSWLVHVLGFVRAEIERVIPFHGETERANPCPGSIDGGNVKGPIGFQKLNSSIHANLLKRVYFRVSLA